MIYVTIEYPVAVLIHAGKREDIMIIDEISVFLDDLPHRYFDENQLHAFILSGMKDYKECIDKVNAFLPYN